MSSRHRRYFSPAAKVAIVRGNLLDGVTELEVCKANKLNRSVLRRWKNELLQNGASAFRRKGAQSDQRQNAAAQGNRKPRAERDR
jgi:transposase-like protein